MCCICVTSDTDGWDISSVHFFFFLMIFVDSECCMIFVKVENKVDAYYIL